LARLIILFSFLFATSESLFAQKDYMPEVLGTWLSENKKQKVKVTFDEVKRVYTGKITWMYEDDQTEGRVLLDKKNPNPKLRTRRVTGINLMHSFVYEGNKVFRGYIYDPISGKEYRCMMTLQPDNKTAHIRGYILIPWIGRTEIATKVSD